MHRLYAGFHQRSPTAGTEFSSACMRKLRPVGTGGPSKHDTCTRDVSSGAVCSAFAALAAEALITFMLLHQAAVKQKA